MGLFSADARWEVIKTKHKKNSVTCYKLLDYECILIRE